jgi:HEAT repeat protein
MVLVATCGVLLWVVRVLRDESVPVREWAQQVRDGTLEQRREAVGKLATVEGVGMPVAVEALAAAIRDEEAQVATIAGVYLGMTVQAASRTGNRDAAGAGIRALLDALKDPRPEVRIAAFDGLGVAAPALGLLEPEVTVSCVDALAAALSDPSAEVRMAAAKAFGPLGTACSIPLPTALVAALEGDASVGVREMAARSLGAFPAQGDLATVALLHALDGDEAAVRKACAEAFRQLETTPGFNKPKRSRAILPELIEALASRERMARFQAAAILREFGPEAGASIPTLVRLLSEAPDAKMTRPSQPAMYWDPAFQATQTLGLIAPPTPQAGEVVAALVSVIRSEASGPRRAWAADVLDRFDPGLTVPILPVLLDVLKETARKDWYVAERVCLAIGEIAPNSPRVGEAVAALAAALDSDQEGTRGPAAVALGKIGAPAKAVLPRLRELAETDRASNVRDSASKSVLLIEEALGNGTP